MLGKRPSVCLHLKNKISGATRCIRKAWNRLESSLVTRHGLTRISSSSDSKKRGTLRSGFEVAAPLNKGQPDQRNRYWLVVISPTITFSSGFA